MTLNMPIDPNALIPLHDSLPHIVVYTKNQCHQCNITKKKLSTNGVPFITVNVEEVDDGDQLREAIVGRFGSMMPAVVAYNVFDAPAYFSGLSPDKVRHLTARWNQVTEDLRARGLLDELYGDTATETRDNWTETAQRVHPAETPTELFDNFYQLTVNGDLV